jgi:hypothetical protein
MSTRNQEIAAMFRSGLTMQVIGDRFLISRARVQKILSEAGIARRDGGAYLRSKAATEDRIRIVQERKQRRNERLGIPPGESMPNEVIRKVTYQRRTARARGIEFLLTPWQWWCVWRDSGHYGDRGRRGHQYVMARIGDDGAYEVGNVYICTSAQNIKDGFVNKPVSVRKKRSSGASHSA